MSHEPTRDSGKSCVEIQPSIAKNIMLIAAVQITKKLE